MGDLTGMLSLHLDRGGLCAIRRDHQSIETDALSHVFV